MFKKKPTIKTLAPLRSSDRRKAADQIIRDYKLEAPAPAPATAAVATAESSTSTTTTEAEQRDSAPDQPPTPSLSDIRNGLFPENTRTGRFTTTAGPNLSAVQGTIYVGAHAGDEERVLWFRVEHGPGSDARLYPTVYALWRNPRLVPLLHTPSLVMGKLFGGADLMTPGLANGPPFPPGATEGAVVAVASLDKPSVPAFVGVCEVDVASLEKVQGVKGHAVRGVQWEGDELWGWSADGRPGRQPPEQLDGWLKGVEQVEQDLGGLSLDEEAAYEGDAADGGVALPNVEEDEPEPAAEEKEPTTKEIDDAFHNAFLYALYQHKRDNPSQPNHGLSFPIQPSYVISNLVTPFLPIRTPQQAQFYNIKKTSWKNVKKFIKHLDKVQLVKSKDRGGGETVILDVDFDDYEIVDFVPYKLPKRSSPEKGGKTSAAPDATAGSTLDVKTVYRPNVKLTPDLFPSLSHTDRKNYYSSSDVSKRLNEYVTSQDPPLVSASNPRVVTLNPFLSNKVIASNTTSDLSTLSQGTILRDALFKRIIEDPGLCAPFHVLVKPGQRAEDVKPKPGALPKVTVTVEKRGSAKTMTRIVGIEVFGVIPQHLADELQKKCASSTSVAQAAGAVKGVLEVMVQGDQRKAVETALNKAGVKTQWIDNVDKRKKKGGS